MVDILNLSFEELGCFVEDIGESPFRTKQIWEWLWHRRAKTFAEMTVLSQKCREILEQRAQINWPEVVETKTSKDGTVKFLLSLKDKELVETVLIPSVSRDGQERFTQCLSCQVGCAMGCSFCSTGSMGFTRNMSMGEILGQVLVAKDYLKDSLDRPRLKNLVFMGMGEPLLNLREVMRSLKSLHHPRGLAFSARRITVSTCGIKNGLEELGASGLAFLAVSLHAPTQAIREQIMPKAAHWPLPDLIKTLKSYPLNTRERLTFEYLLLGGINDTPEHARELAKLMSHIKAKLNLIAYNPAEGSLYKAPKYEDILAFEKVLWAKGITATLRKSKGQDIEAACGQLAVKAKG